MWGVVEAVDAEAVVEGQAWCTWGEQRQLQAFTGGLRRAGLAHQAVRSQLLHQNMAALFLQLQVARGRQGLLSYRQHLLKNSFQEKLNDLFSLGQVCLWWGGGSCLTSHAPWCVCVLSVRVQSGVGVSSWAQWGNVRTTGRFSSMPDGPQLTTGLRTV